MWPDPLVGGLRLMCARAVDRIHPHHRETQARLAAAEERYQTLVDRLPIATYVMKVGLPATGATYVSSGIERLTGYPMEEWLRDRDLLYEILHPDDQELAADHWESVVAGGQTSFVLDYRIIHRDGRIRWLREMSDLREIDGKPVLEGVWVDITDRMEAEEALAVTTKELTEANERLLELDRIRTMFFTTASHELRTPLTSLLGYSDIVDQRWDELSDAQRRDHVRTIHKQSLRMARLVRDVLAASEMDQGLLKVDPQPTDVSSVVEAAARSHASETAAVRIDADGRPIALADPVRLEQILSNLLANAVRFGRPPVVVDIARNGAFVEIRVRDRGPGVPDDLRSRVFDRFELSAAAGDLIQQGFGLGLSVARDLARAQGGELALEDSSVGATFVLTLPAALGFS
jgi:PAS domain S-box-containing protein